MNAPSAQTTLAVRVERFPINGTFTISRGSKTEVVVVVAELTRDGVTGRGECVPYARYGESVEGVVTDMEALGPEIARGLDRIALQARMKAGAARNALDCAFWDLEAKRLGVPAHALAGIIGPEPKVTAFTLSLDEPHAMAEAARAEFRPLLKLKLGGEGDEARIAAVRNAAPKSRLIVDANESWEEAALPRLMTACAAAGVELIEQPLPADRDQALARMARPVPVCADESVHDRKGLSALRDRYDAINIKLDKTGGLTEAFLLADEAQAQGFTLMVGSMLATSLSMAPAMLVAQKAKVVDLDGPLLLARDRVPGLLYEGGFAYPPEPELWG